MRTWTRTNYKIIETGFDYSLHQFHVVTNNGKLLATITPGSLKDQNDIIKALDAGEDVNGWEDGHGNTISL